MPRSVWIACLLLTAPLWAKKDKPEEQALALPPALPAATIADTSQLVFGVSPLYSRGLLSHQLREALKWLLSGGQTIVKLRAFVAGTGDTRRVRDLVSEVFTDKHAPLPALSVVQVGALARDGAQVVLESVAQERKPVNPNGVAFIAPARARVDKPFAPLAPLAGQVAERLSAALDGARVRPQDVLRITCYVSVLDGAGDIGAPFAARWPAARLNLVQPLRETLASEVACEAVGRLSEAPRERIEFLPGAVAAGPGNLIFTGAQLAFGTAADDAELAFTRLRKTLQEVAGRPLGPLAAMNIYALRQSTGELAREAAAGLFPQPTPPALSVESVEGLPAMDASFSADAIAVLPDLK
jgi:enamine deaminase RidA (YjgF/YER057c/UK114 family)